MNRKYCRWMSVALACLLLPTVLVNGSEARVVHTNNPAINTNAIMALRVDVTNSPDCEGGDNGRQVLQASYESPGCLGYAYAVTNHWEDRMEGKRAFMDTIWIGRTNVTTGEEYYVGFFQLEEPTGLDYLDCGVDQAGEGLLYLHGEDRFVIGYDTVDGKYHTNCFVAITNAFILEEVDDHGDIEFVVKDSNDSGDDPVLKVDPAHPELIDAQANVSNPHAYPTNRQRWEIVTDAEHSDLGLQIDQLTGKITVRDTNAVLSGQLKVQVSDSEKTYCYLQDELKVCTSTCSSCTSPVAGTGSVEVNSVDVRIGFGRFAFGKQAGVFGIREERPANVLYSASGLHFTPGGDAVSVVRDTNGLLAQVKGDQALANLVPGTWQYALEFYKAGDYATTVGTNGLYAINTGASPYQTWTFLNPDGGSATNRFRVIEANSGGASHTNDYVWDATLQGWELIQDNGRRKEKKYASTAGDVRTETRIIRNELDVVKYFETHSYRTLAWGEELVEQQIGDGTNALVTTWQYYTNQTSDGINYGKLKQVIGPGGHWERYYYNDMGQKALIVRQYLDNPLPTTTAEENANRVTTHYYYSDGQETYVDLNGVEVSHTIQVRAGNYTIDFQCQSAGATYDSVDNLVTETWVYPSGPFAGYTEKVKAPNGVMTIYTYADSADGSYRTNTVTTGQANTGETGITDGTQTVTVLDRAGNRLLERTFDVTSGLLTSSSVVTQSDDLGRPTVVQYLDGSTETTVYGCCGIESFTDREGTTTSYVYDDLKRPMLTTRAGIATRTDYDAAGRVEKTTRIGTDNSEIILSSSAYDTAGRVTSSTAPANGSAGSRTTTFTEIFDGNGHRVRTATYPDNSTRVETYAQDSSLLSVSGTAVHPVNYQNGVDGDYGEYTQQIRVGSGGEQTEWVMNFRDLVGRDYLTVFSAPAGQTNAYAYSSYDWFGNLWQQVDPDGVINCYVYNAKGEREYVAVDMDRDGYLYTNTGDRLTRTVTDVISDHGTVVRRTQTFVWPTNNVGTSVLVNTTENSVDAHQTWTSAFGLTNTAQVYLAGNGTRYVTNTLPDGTYTRQTFQDGSLTSSQTINPQLSTLNSVSYAYDTHGRQNSATDVRNGATTYTYNDADRVNSVTSPVPAAGQSAQLTTNYFDNLDRLWKVGLPDGTSVTSEYFATGELKKTYGSRTYPVEYTYDSVGRMKTMKTWQNFAGNSGTAVTTWNYDSYRGFLTNKVYAGSSAGPSYTYTAAGRLSTRGWARGITTTYSYNNAGELQTADYSDSTPDVTYVSDRLGRPQTVTQGTNVCNYSYADNGQLVGESTTGGILAGLSLANGYDALLRPTNLVAQHSSTPILQHSISYDAASRLQTVTDGTNGATYSYLANSPLVDNIVFKQNGTTRMTATKQYDYLNRLQSISSAPAAAGQSPLSYAYAYNNANQRTATTNSDNSRWVYIYDSLGQVTSGKKYWADGTPVAGQQFAYGFDDIGNRATTQAGGDQYGANLRYASYTANTLNQYTSRTVPGAVDILGSATNTATVTVNDQGTHRSGDYYRKELSLDNSTAPVFQSVTNLAVLNNNTNADIVTSITGTIFLPKTPESFGYDADGNMTNDGRWTFTWDGENRLISMQAVSTVPSGAKKKLDFIYDHQGRRIQKIVSTWNGSAYVPASTNKFLYGGWNLIAELDGTNGVIRSYMWGLDLSGQAPLLGGAGGGLQGAGGVGGLLAIKPTGTNTLFVACDGNGNVTDLIDAATGTTSGQFEYGPFGETIRLTLNANNQSPFRFSTKYTDDESDFLYYGYRYYNPSTGRWLSRDPIEEYGGINLYGFGGNSPIGKYDPFGLTSIGQILDEYFSPWSRPRTWVMGSHDAYTGIVRKWQPVIGAVNAAEADLKANCDVWAKTHVTSPTWTPQTAVNGSADPNAWIRLVPSPPGTDPNTARRNFIIYVLTGYQTDDLHTSAIGSFWVYATVDKVDCCKKTATLRIWMYNRMSRQSFGRFANQFPFNLSGQANQDMWWNWTEDYSWGPPSSPPKTGTGGGW